MEELVVRGQSRTASLLRAMCQPIVCVGVPVKINVVRRECPPVGISRKAERYCKLDHTEMRRGHV